MTGVLISIYCLLIKNPDNPLNKEEAKLYNKNIIKYNDRVNQDVRKYALI